MSVLPVTLLSWTHFRKGRRSNRSNRKLLYPRTKESSILAAPATCENGAKMTCSGNNTEVVTGCLHKIKTSLLLKLQSQQLTHRRISERKNVSSSKAFCNVVTIVGSECLHKSVHVYVYLSINKSVFYLVINHFRITNHVVYCQ